MEVGKVTAFLVDLRRVIEFFSSCEVMYWLYRQYPLQAIITTILSEQWKYSDNFERFINECIDRNVDPFDEHECEIIQVFYDAILQCLDKEIYRMVKIDMDLSELVLDTWTDSTSVILRIEPVTERRE